jgi:hypothetical protein
LKRWATWSSSVGAASLASDTMISSGTNDGWVCAGWIGGDAGGSACPGGVMGGVVGGDAPGPDGPDSVVPAPRDGTIAVISGKTPATSGSGFEPTGGVTTGPRGEPDWPSVFGGLLVTT